MFVFIDKIVNEFDNKNNEKEITIIIPTFNNVEFLGETLQSIINSIKNIEEEFLEQEHFISLISFNSKKNNVIHFTDQSSFNLVVHNELIKDKIDINSDFALQVGTTTKDLKIENDIFQLFDE